MKVIPYKDLTESQRLEFKRIIHFSRLQELAAMKFLLITNPDLFHRLFQR